MDSIKNELIRLRNEGRIVAGTWNDTQVILVMAPDRVADIDAEMRRLHLNPVGEPEPEYGNVTRSYVAADADAALPVPGLANASMRLLKAGLVRSVYLDVQNGRLHVLCYVKEGDIAEVSSALEDIGLRVAPAYSGWGSTGTEYGWVGYHPA
jgi:hypothetical protein